MKTFKIILLLLCLSVLFISNAEDKGEFYKIPNTKGAEGLKGLAAKIAVKDAVFRYNPGYGKQGILNDLYLTDFAISPDNSVLALSEARAESGNFLNRIIFFDYLTFKVINGIEFKSGSAVQKIFFFFNRLFCVMNGKTVTLSALNLDNKLKFYNKKFTIPAPVSSIVCSKDFIYIKCKDNTLLQIDDALHKNASVQTRRQGGQLFLIPETDKLVNLTKDNAETIRISEDGLFKSTFANLKNKVEPVDVFVIDDPEKSLFFSSRDGELYELVDFNYSQKCDVANFQHIFYHRNKEVFYSLAAKKHQLEIITLPDFKIKKRLTPDTMRPKTHKNLKFMIPHPQGAFVITQQGEFFFLKEHKKRFYKEKIQ